MGAIGGEDLPEVAGSRGEKILVSVRLRPLSEKEAARNDVSEWECISDNTIICRNNLAASERSMYPSAYTFGKTKLLLHVLNFLFFVNLLIQSGVLDMVAIIRPSHKSLCYHGDLA